MKVWTVVWAGYFKAKTIGAFGSRAAAKRAVSKYVAVVDSLRAAHAEEKLAELEGEFGIALSSLPVADRMQKISEAYRRVGPPHDAGEYLIQGPFEVKP